MEGNNITQIKKRLEIIKVIYVVFGIFCILSIMSELLISNSIFGSCRISCPIFLRSGVVLEIIKIIGFSNIFLGFLYTNLNKKMLAISYEDILKAISLKHNEYTIFHLICNLVCLSLSAGGLSESALAALVLVLNGFVYQWIILYNVVINSEICKKLAKEIWITQEHKDLFEDLCKLAKTLPERNSRYYKDHIWCFTYLLSQYVEDKISCTHIDKLSAIWLIFAKNGNIDNMLRDIANALFDSLILNDSISDDKKNTILCNFFTAYMLFKLRSKDKNVENLDMNTLLKNLINDMWSLDYLLPNRSNDELKETYLKFINCWRTNIHILAWVFFQQGKLLLTKEIFDIIPDEKYVSYVYIDELIYAFFFYEKEKIKNALDIAKQQLNGRLQVEGVR